MAEPNSVEERLKTALDTLGYDVQKNVYQGKSKTYIVFNYNTIPVHHSDDEPEFDKYLIQVHFFAPISFKAGPVAARIKSALRDAGFTWPSMEHAGDDSGQHVVLETDWAEGLGEEDD